MTLLHYRHMLTSVAHFILPYIPGKAWALLSQERLNSHISNPKKHIYRLHLFLMVKLISCKTVSFLSDCTCSEPKVSIFFQKFSFLDLAPTKLQISWEKWLRVFFLTQAYVVWMDDKVTAHCTVHKINRINFSPEPESIQLKLANFVTLNRSKFRSNGFIFGKWHAKIITDLSLRTILMTVTGMCRGQ